MSTVVVFSATWCPPCQQYKGVVDTFAGQTEHKVLRIDIDEHPTTTEAYGVKSVPTTVLQDDSGKELGRLKGVQTLEALNELVS